jgi:hypothetical protein
VDTRADAGKLRRLFVDIDREAGLLQQRGSSSAAQACADDGDFLFASHRDFLRFKNVAGEINAVVSQRF